MTNRELVERQIDSGNRFAVEEIEELFSEDAVWDASRSIGPSRGIYRGKEEIEPLLMSYLEAFESIIATPIEIYERGNWIAVDTHVRMRGRGSGIEVEARGGRVYELRDGKIARYVQFQSMDEAREFVDAQP